MATTLPKCPKPNCTVDTTGICLLSHKPDDCPELNSAKAAQPTALPTSEPKAEEVAAPVVAKSRQFHSGLELGTDDAALIMRQDYTHLIGILGSFNAGKTCFLSSLYLMAANGYLRPRYTFKGSQTLQGFEDRARFVRDWTEGGTLPESLADHTILTDERRPSLLHLALQVENRPEPLNLLFTDSPGEWSKNLVDHTTTAPLLFFNRAEVVLIVIDCVSLTSDRRRAETNRTKLLLERLASDVKLDRSIPIILVLAKADEVDMKQPPMVTEITDCGKAFGFKMDLIMTAAFSSKPGETENGEGVVACLDKILEFSQPAPHTATILARGPRMFERFRA